MLNQQAPIDLTDQLVEQIRESIGRSQGSELQLQGEIDGHLRRVLATFAIDYNPQVNQSLRRSYSASGRPDSLFGHVVLDYKAPGTLRSAAALGAAKAQIVNQYLKPIGTRGATLDAAEAAKWVGVLLDGRDLLFATFDGSADWTWSPVRPVNRYTILSLLQYYRALYRKPLDPYLLSADFGRDTDVAVSCIRVLADYLEHPSARTRMLFKEWRRLFEQVSTYELDQIPALATWARTHSLSIQNDAALILYCLHTYYALIVKILTAELLTASQHFGLESYVEALAHADAGAPFKAELTKLESGETFHDLRILNFLEGDFFAWYLLHFDRRLERALRRIVDVFRTYEPATPRLNPRRSQDLLKVFYSGVIDGQIRHDLGEYYTPDWLAELTLDKVGYTGQIGARVLDPACGSGTFIVSAIQRLMQTCDQNGLAPAETINRVVGQIHGFDLNPLAVISARANYLLSISAHIAEFGADVEIPIYLSDCINVPVRRDVGGVDCLIYELDTELGPRLIALPTSLVRAQVMGLVLHAAESHVARQLGADEFVAAIGADPVVSPHLGNDEIAALRAFYAIIEELESRDWDEIWCRIIKNHFASQSLGEVDFVVGNPPWVRWSRLPRRYRERCKEFCQHYGLVSGRGYSGGIESDIATVVAYSSADNWLREGGHLGFLITATVYKTDSARGFRRFQLPDGAPLKPHGIVDLVALQPFPDATNETSMILLEKLAVGESPDTIYPSEGIPYTVWRSAARGSKRIDPRLSLPEVVARTTREELRAEPIADRGSPLFTGTPEDIRLIEPFRGSSAYEHESHKGTTTDLARVFWVKVIARDARARRAKIRSLTTTELGVARSEGVETTNGYWIEDDLLFPLMRGRDLGRFCQRGDDWYLIVPNRHYEKMPTEDEFRRRYPLAFRYFNRNRHLLERRSTYMRYLRGKPFFAIYDVGDYTFAPYKVVWMEQQNPREFRAAVVSTAARSAVRNRLIVPDHKLYMLTLSDEDAAHYVCAVLNSRHLRRILGGFLAGKQIGTTIFRYVGVPIYDGTEQTHRDLAEISREAHRARVGQNITTDLSEPQQTQLDRLTARAFARGNRR